MKYKKPLVELINSRVSRRDYSDKEIEPKKLKELEKIIKKPLIGPFGCASRFIIQDTGISIPDKKVKIGTYGMINGARYFIVGFINKTKKDLIDFGYSMEKIILKATDLELGTCWLGAKYASNAISKQFTLGENEFIPAISPIGYVNEKHSTKESIISWTLRARKRKSWNKLFFLDNTKTPLTEDIVGKYAIPLEWVRLAPSGKNTQQWRIIKEKNREVFHFYIDKKINFPNNKLNKLNLLDAGIALCHFELGALDQKIGGNFIFENPKLTNIKESYHYIASWVGKK